MKQSKYVMYLIGIILSFLCAATFAENSSDEARIDKKLYPVFDGVSLISATKVFYGKTKVTIKTIFPRLVSDTENDTENEINESIDAFNETVDSFVKNEVNEFRKEVYDNLPTQKTLLKSQQTNDMELDFDASTINTKNNHIISIRFSIQQYIGGMAHPKHYHRVLNYDMDTNKILTLDDLFAEDSDYLSVISAYSKKQLSRHLQNTDMIEKGTEPTEKNFKNWNIKPDGLLFTFDEYQVAPYFEGTQTVLVPYSFLKGMMEKDSPIADCVYKKHKCGRNNLLTGGFIDEAANTRHSRLNPTFS